MRGVLHEVVGTWPGRILCMVLLLPVPGVGVLFVAGHSATSVHITATTLACGNCTEDPGKVLFDKTFTDSSFVRSLQDAMNTAPVPPDWPICSFINYYDYTFTFMTVGKRVAQTYTGTLTCIDYKTTLGVAAIALVKSFPFVSVGVETAVVTYQGKPLLDALHHDIGLPVELERQLPP
jgi:hypothetical protein